MSNGDIQAMGLEGESTGLNGDRSPNSIRVLVVDDSDVIRQRLLALLNPLPGVAVVGQATTLEEGWVLFLTERPDVVTLDLNLRGGSGLDLLKKIRERDESPGDESPIVIVLTNYPYPMFRTRSEELGAEHFLTKTRDFHQVRSILEELVSGGLGSGTDGAEAVR